MAFTEETRRLLPVEQRGIGVSIESPKHSFRIAYQITAQPRTEAQRRSSTAIALLIGVMLALALIGGTLQLGVGFGLCALLAIIVLAMLVRGPAHE